MGLFNKLFGKKEQQETIDTGLQKTREGFLGKISKAIAGKSTVDDEVLDNLEDALVSADIGVETTVKIIGLLEKRVAKAEHERNYESGFDVVLVNDILANCLAEADNIIQDHLL